MRVLATVAELRKRLGDSVEKGEIVAAIESREVADAKSEYLAARVTNELRQTIFSASEGAGRNPRTCRENEFLRTQLAANEAQIKLDGARQKLFALGLSEERDRRSAAISRRKACAGKNCARRSRAGSPSGASISAALVGREGQESELFVIVNLDSIWVDLAVSPEDIAAVHEGAPISIRAIGIDGEVSAKIIFVSPLLDRETRNARVVASLPNPDHRWKPGTFVTAEIPLGDEASQGDRAAQGAANHQGHADAVRARRRRL